MRSLVAVVAAFGLLVACSPAPPSPPTALPLPTATPVPAPTTPPTTVAANVDYKALRQPLLIPLGALIVAVRARTPTTTYWLDQFNKAADQVLPAIDGDSSPNATRLRTSIMNVRAMPDNLDALEKSRADLLQI